MRKLLILGAGTAGTIMANKMRKALSGKDWSVTVVEKELNHYYQPGFLFIPFGYYQKNEIQKSIVKFLPISVNVIKGEIGKIDPAKNSVSLTNGISVDYDVLIVATGARISPEDTPGLKAELWHKNIFDFYTIEGAEALKEFFKTWKGGNLVINIADNPIKCPVAPLEFAFLADSYFTSKSMREKVNITYVTPMSGAFTKPKASKMLGTLVLRKL